MTPVEPRHEHPTPYSAAVAAAESIILPEHVRRAYRATPLRDAFMDRRHRTWHAETDALRQALPADPLEHKTIPPEFWERSVRRVRFHTEHGAAKRQLDEQHAEREASAQRNLSILD